MSGMCKANQRQSSHRKNARTARRNMNKTNINKAKNIAKAMKNKNKVMKVPRGTTRHLRRHPEQVTVHE
jgi:hypothetical protein